MDPSVNRDFLKGARLVSRGQGNKPPFLEGARLVSKGEQQFPFEQEGDLERDIERQQARLTSRGIETVLGTPGNIESLINMMTGREKTTLPTSSDLKSTSEKLTKGYTAPKTEAEELSDEVVSDIAAMALPGSNSYSLFRNIGIPIVGQLAKQGLKYGGLDDQSSTASKTGLMVAFDLLTQRSKGGARKVATDLLDKAEKAVPQGTLVSAKSLDAALTNLEHNLKKGGSHPEKAEALSKIKEISDKIDHGHIDLHELIPFRKSLSAWTKKFGGFDLSLPGETKKGIINNLNKVKDIVIRESTKAGEHLPEFADNWRLGNEAFAAYARSNVVSNAVAKASHNLSSAVKHLFGVGASTAAVLATGGAKAGVPIALAGAAAYPGIKLFLRVQKSPVLAKYYKNVMNGALKGNASQVSNNLAALDKALQESDSDVYE